ncbi:MAG TPA: hypothetical protein VI316_06835, partial [Candidatus Dormibacteraeota bacterium]
MFLMRPFVRRYDRVRGNGWLDCPNCHEHTSQDVVDEMTFACIAFYRLTPIFRRRRLVCRRCQYRRPATKDELQGLETSGKRIRRAWLFPVGATPIVLMAALTLYVANHSTEVVSAVTFGVVDLEPITVGQLKIPVDYNRTKDTEVDPPTFTATNLSGTYLIRLRRIPLNMTPAQILAANLTADESVFEDTGFPQTVNDLPSPPKYASLAATNGLVTTFPFKHGTDNAQMTIYAFNHFGVSYTLSFEVIGDATIKESAGLTQTIATSLSMINNHETAA